MIFRLIRQLVRAGFAALLALIATVVLFVLFGAILPVWIMGAINGWQAVEDAPAHRCTILFLTVPFAAVIFIPTFLLLTGTIFEKFNAEAPKARLPREH